MNIKKIEIYRAFAKIAYAVAKTDKGLSADEKIAFNLIAEQDLEPNSWIAQSRFELLDVVTQSTIDIAYNEALCDLKKYREHLTEQLKEKAIRVLKRVTASCSGYSEKERLIIDRFTNDLTILINSK
jgi:hypothetical protein